MNRIGTSRICKLRWILVLLILFVENPPASPVMNRKSNAGDSSEAAIGGREAKSSASTRKPGKIIIVYTGDLQGNLGPCG